MIKWVNSRSLGQKLCLGLGSVLTLLFVVLMLLVPMSVGRLPDDWRLLTPWEVILTSSFLTPLVALLVLGAAFSRSRWLIPGLVAVSSVLDLRWQLGMGVSLSTTIFSVLLSILCLGSVVWAGWVPKVSNSIMPAAAGEGDQGASLLTPRGFFLSMLGVVAVSLILALIGFGG